MSTSNNENNKELNTSFLDTNPDKEKLSHRNEGSTGRLTSGDQVDDQPHSGPLTSKSTGVGPHLTILSLRPTLPGVTPTELQERPVQDILVEQEVTDKSSEFQNDLSDTPAPINTEVTLGLNHIIDTNTTGAFYEDTLAFDHRIFGELVSTASTSLSTSSIGIDTQSFDNHLFNFTSTSDALETEAPFIIPQNTENISLLGWAQRYGICTSDDCFIDLLSLVAVKPILIGVERGIKRSAPKEFAMPAAKTICKEVRKYLSVAPKRKAMTGDIKHKPRIVQVSVWPRRTAAKASWIPVHGRN
ncbi:hypothetical protein DFP73DRAFT_592161 [Morchella snyderi]|nr:hypothetical protein DFP73DRAFT_592161 [Morchella snyderi]